MTSNSQWDCVWGDGKEEIKVNEVKGVGLDPTGPEEVVHTQSEGHPRAREKAGSHLQTRRRGPTSN